MSLTDQPITVLPEDVDDLVATILDVDRRGLVFVAGAGNEAGVLAPFTERLPRWTGQIHGLGQAYLLVPGATAIFNERMGAFGVRPWSLRTYYPSVDREDLEDSRRHRYLTTATLSRLSPAAVSNLLGSIARAHAASHAEEPDVVRVRRIFERRATARVVEALQPTREPAAAEVETLTEVAPEVEKTPTPQVETSAASSLRRLLALVRSVLGIDEITEESLRARAAKEQRILESASEATGLIEDQQDAIYVLEDDLGQARRALDDAQLDEAELHEQLDDLRGENRWLRERLIASQDYESAYGTPGEPQLDERPQGLVDVATALLDEEVPRVVFCGDIDRTIEVQVADTVGNAARTAWDACLTLGEYAAAVVDEGYDGGFDHYLRQSGRSTRLSPGRHTVGETKATLEQFGHQRDFPDGPGPATGHGTGDTAAHVVRHPRPEETQPW